MTLLSRYFYIDEFSRFDQVLRTYRHTRKTFAKGEFICRPGEPLTKCYYIAGGMAEMSVVHPDGDKRIFGYWGRGGIYPLIVSEQRFNLEYAITLRAITPVDALAFDIDAMRDIVLSHPDVGAVCVEHYGRFVNTLLFGSLACSFDSVMERLASFLRSCLIYLPNTDNSISLSQEDIASVIGATRVSVSRELSELRRLGIVKTSRNRIVVTNVKRLEDMGSKLFLEVDQ